MIKYATAIRTGTASTEAILRRFAKANAVHPAYQAMAEVGRAQRTIFLAAFCVIVTCSGRSTKGSTSWSPGTAPTQ